MWERVSVLALGFWLPISHELVRVTSSFSPYTDHIWIKGKKNQLDGLTKLRAVHGLRTWPSSSFCQKHPCPSLSVVHVDLILPLCHSLGPSYAALQFANPEYITVSGKAPFFLSYSWHQDLPLFSSCPQNNCGILLSRKIAKRNKKNLTSWKWCSPSGFLSFPFLLSPHQELQPEKEQWDESCPISH